MICFFKFELKQILCIALFFVLPNNSFGQLKGFSPELSINDLIMDQWTNESGLRSNNLTSIKQSQNGYLWITSHNGIHKFDGVKFLAYGKDNVSQLVTSTAFTVYEDEKGTLYFATESSGILQYKKNKFYSHPKNNSFPKATLTSLIDTNGTYWIGTKNYGLFTIRQDSITKNISAIPEISINCVNLDENGSVFASTDGNGIYKIDKDSIIHFGLEDGLLSDVVNFSYIIGNSVYIGTINGLNIWNGKVMNKISAFDGIDINQIAIDDYGSIWAATEEGLARLIKGAESLEHFTADHGLAIKQVSDLLFDDEGSLWLSTKKAGLIRLKQGNIKNIASMNGLTSDRVNVVARKNDNYFIGTDDGSINIYNQNKVSTKYFGEKFHNAGIRDFLFESNGDCWVISYEGALKISENKSILYNINNGLPANELRRIFKDSKAQIWLGSRVAGLIKFNQKDNNNHTVYDKTNGLSSNYIFSIEEDNRGNIIVGTNAGGLSIINERGEVKTYHIKDDDSGILIFNTFIDEHNLIFACTNIGLFVFKDGAFKKIEFTENLQFETFFDLVADEIGGYWLTSNNGVVKIKKTEVNEFLSEQLDVVEVDIYDQEDGMSNNECTGATRSYYDPISKKIWVPTFSGAAVIDPSIEFTNKKIPPVYISEFTIDDKQVDLDNDEFEIDFRVFRYTFNFTSLSYLTPSKVKFMYKLEGFDKDWIGPVTERSVQYTNLPAKKFTFFVKGSNSDGVWNETPASFSFEIVPFFYKTKWFYSLVTLAVVLLLFGMYKWRIRSVTKRNNELKKINNELDTFVYSASHDLRAPLASIMSLVSLLKEESEEEDKAEYIELIDQCAQKMDVFIHDIIDYSRNKNKGLDIEKIMLKDLIEESYESLKYLKLDSKVELNIELNNHGFIFNDQRRLRVILSNLIGNAISYSDKIKLNPFVSINVKSDGEFVHFVVADNGIGIEKGEIDNIFTMFYRTDENTIGSGLGLYIVKEALEKLGGNIQVESEVGVGTKFSFTLPNHQITP